MTPEQISAINLDDYNEVQQDYLDKKLDQLSRRVPDVFL